VIAISTDASADGVQVGPQQVLGAPGAHTVWTTPNVGTGQEVYSLLDGDRNDYGTLSARHEFGTVKTASECSTARIHIVVEFYDPGTSSYKSFYDHRNAGVWSGGQCTVTTGATVVAYWPTGYRPQWRVSAHTTVVQNGATVDGHVTLEGIWYKGPQDLANGSGNW
jgi:hypothetical protein